MKKTALITGLSAIALNSIVPTASADTLSNGSYTVQAGDTLQKIAAKFDISIDTLRANNQLGKYLTIGQKLVITPTASTTNSAVSAQALPSGSTAEFANAIAETTKQTTLNEHFFTSVMIAQAILESQSGRSGLAQNYNNYFGIKGAYEGQSISLSTQEEVSGSNTTVNANFRVYPSPAASVQDYADLFTRNSWSSNHYAAFINAKTPTEAANALTGTYATDSSYGSKLIQLINTYDLAQYDVKNANTTTNTTTEETTLTTYKVQAGDTLKKIAAKYKTTYEAIATTNKITAPYTIYPQQELKIAIIKQVEQLKTYTVKKGDTLSAIAYKNNMTYTDLAAINRLSAPYIIHVGQVIALENSDNSTTVAPEKPVVTQSYTVKTGDTLTTIAAKYSKTWTELQKINNLKNPNQLVVGQKITIK